MFTFLTVLFSGVLREFQVPAGRCADILRIIVRCTRLIFGLVRVPAQPFVLFVFVVRRSLEGCNVSHVTLGTKDYCFCKHVAQYRYVLQSVITLTL